MINANEARLIAAKGQQEFYDREDVKDLFDRLESDIRAAANKGLEVVRYIKSDASIFDVYDNDELSMICGRLEDFGFSAGHTPKNKEGGIDFVSIKWSKESNF